MKKYQVTYVDKKFRIKTVILTLTDKEFSTDGVSDYLNRQAVKPSKWFRLVKKVS